MTDQFGVTSRLMPKFSAFPYAIIAVIVVINLIACSKSSEQKLAEENQFSNRIPFAADVDGLRIIQADQEPGVWMTYGRTYDEQRYSPLDQINSTNVNQLGLSWSADINTSRGQEATPIIVDGALYISTAWSMVKAYNIETGEMLWEFDPQVDRAKGVDACCDVVNRGVAVWAGKVFVGTLDGRLIALNSLTGEKIWEKITVDQTKPYTITGAPRVIKGKVIIGNGGAEYGVRGYVTAYDVDTGEQQWRFYTIPGNPAEGFEQPELEMAAETWNGEWWKQGGGGTVWDAMAYDPTLDLLYLGVGNGSPWNQSLRSPGGGDNLFLASIVAIDPDDGSYRWHYQTTPGETWDYTATQHIMLADLEIEGEKQRVVMQAPKNGFFYVLDAATGDLISANNFVPINWASHVDMETGRPVENPDARYDLTGVPFIVHPGPQGGHNWHPMAFSQQTKWVYIPAREQFTGYVSDNEFAAQRRGWNTGTDFSKGAALIRQAGDEIADRKAYLLAWNPVTQREEWRVEHIDPRGASGVLATAGGLVFQGTTSGEFVAYDAKTGEKLWSQFTQAAVVAAPSTFLVGGQQHVAVLVGARGLPTLGPGASPSTTKASTNNSRLLVYKLNGNATLPTFNTQTLSTNSTALPVPTTNASSETIAQGERVYGRLCSVCHGSNAVSQDPGTFPDLRRSPRLVSAEGWANVVLRGELANKGMVSFSASLEQGDAEAIRAYVISQAQP